MSSSDRRRRERRARLEAFIEETEEDLDGDGSTGTVDDLVIDDRFLSESGTLTITDEDLPIELGANPLPMPVQGIRRVGMVLNFNFVWDSDEEQWIRDEGNGGATSGTLGKAAQAHVDEGVSLIVSSGFPATTVPLADYSAQAFDPEGAFDLANNRYAPGEAGLYHMFHSMQYDTFTTGQTWQSIMTVVTDEVGSIDLYGVGNQTVYAADGFETVTGSAIVELEANEAVELRTQHSTGGNEEIAAFEASVYLGGYKIR